MDPPVKLFLLLDLRVSYQKETGHHNLLGLKASLSIDMKGKCLLKTVA